MRIDRFEDIEAWKLARELTRKVYALTKKVKFARDFGLKGQIQDAAGSSMHNIAEGFDSETNPEFVRFLRYAKRSCTEIQSELYVALDQRYITKAEFQEVYDYAGRTRAAIRGFTRLPCEIWNIWKNRLLEFYRACLKKQMDLRHKRAGQLPAGLRARPTEEN
jgi:four helix bundle protein